MQGLTQGSPLTVDRLLRHAAGAYGQAEVVTAAPEGAPRRLSYIQFDARVRRLAGALVESGVGSGDVVAAIGCGTARQLEAWFAVMMTGAASRSGSTSTTLSPWARSRAAACSGGRPGLIG